MKKRLKYLKTWVVNHMNDIKIRNRLLISFSILITAVIIFFGLITYKENGKLLMDRTMQDMQVSMRQLSENVKNRLNLYEEISKHKFYDQVLIESLATTYANRTDAFDAFIKSRNIMGNLIKSDPTIADVSIFIYNDTFLTDNAYFKRMDENMQKEQWFKEIMNIKTDVVWSGPYSNNKNENVIALRRLLFDYEYTNSILGVLSIEIPVKTIHDYIKAESNTRGILIFSGDYDLITSANTDFIGNDLTDSTFVKKAFESDSGTFYDEVDGKKYLIVHNTGYAGWKFINIAPYNELAKSAKMLGKSVIIVCTIAVICCFGVSYTISSALTRRLDILARGVHKVGAGKYDTKITVVGKDEVGCLAETFNDMVDRIQHAFNEVYGANLKRKEAELQSLQAQMNPHFLYNVLSSMSWLANKDRVDELGQMILLLAKYYRFSLSTGNNIVTLEEEIEQIKTYISIQKVRFGDLINVAYDIDKSILDCRTVKLSIQPLVENCINHAMKGNDEALHIEIRSSVDREYLMIEVKDDGVGIPEKQLAEILSGGFESGKKNGGFGIKSVDERIKLYFNRKDCGVTITSTEGKGTTVAIVMPYMLRS